MEASEPVKLNKRNVTLDLLRGYYLFIILIDHLGYKFYTPIYGYFNGYGNLWVSAAEGFVFISGLLLGIIITKKLQKNGLSFVIKNLFLRSSKLFFLHTILTVSFTLLAINIGDWPELGNGILIEPFRNIFTHTVTLRYNYGWADVLILYSIFIAFSSLFFIAKSRNLVAIPFILSLFLWIYSYKTERVYNSYLSSFEILSWQFLFYIGVVTGMYKAKLTEFYKTNKKLIIAFVFLLFGITYFLSIQSYFFGNYYFISKESASVVFVKQTLGPGRLITFFIWFIFYYYIFDLFKENLKKHFGWILLTFGKNSLVTYIIQSIILFLAYYVYTSGHSFVNFVITSLGVVVVVTMVYAYKNTGLLINKLRTAVPSILYSSR